MVWDQRVATTERCPPANASELALAFFEGNAPSLPWCGTSVWQRQSVALQANASELALAFFEGNAPSLPWCGTSVWQRQSVALQALTAKLALAFFEGNAPSLPWCGTSVWQRQSVALQANASELVPRFLTVTLIAPCCHSILTRVLGFSFLDKNHLQKKRRCYYL